MEINQEPFSPTLQLFLDCMAAQEALGPCMTNALGVLAVISQSQAPQSWINAAYQSVGYDPPSLLEPSVPTASNIAEWPVHTTLMSH